jgi:ArsR family transcriptional regulator, arsenate/arsenite/antimonite-responsive transcriptional repressor
VETEFSRGTTLLKALADETRVRIVHILSCGELCACDLLDYFDISQPTLSHHLGILVDAGLVATRPDGKWMHYSVNRVVFDFFEEFIHDLSHETETCLCKKTRRNCK